MDDSPHIKAAHETTRSQTKAFWISAVAAVMSLVISSGSLWIAYNTQHETSAAQKEAVFLQLTPFRGEYETTFELDVSGDAAILTRWVLTAVNTGNKPLSLVRITSLASYPNESPGIGLSTRWTQVADEHQANLLALPLLLQPAEARNLLLDVWVNLPSSQFELLKKQFPQSRLISMRAVDRLLRQHGFDCYGNVLIPINEPDKLDGRVLFWVRRTDTNAQIITVSLKTARGDDFKAVISTGQLNIDNTVDAVYNE